MKIRSTHYFLGIFAALSLYSCKGTKHLAEGEILYDKGTVTIHKDSIPADRRAVFETYMATLLTPKPNKKLFGQRFKLGMYYAGGGADTSKNFFRNFLKKRGEAPVLLSSVNREYNETILRGRMENLGFFNSYVTSDTIRGIICLILQITLIGWLPAAIWAVASLIDTRNKRRIQDMRR